MRGRVVFALFLAGCGGQSGENSTDLCTPAEVTDLEPGDATMGFSAEEVLAAMAMPTSVQWVSEDAAPQEDSLTMDLRISGQVQSFDFTALEMCERGRELRIPMSADLTVGEGGIVVEDGTLDVWATGVDPYEIALEVGWDMPAELDGAYQTAFDAWWADRQARDPGATDWQLHSTHVSFGSSWGTPWIAVEASYESSMGQGQANVWEGWLGFPE